MMMTTITSNVMTSTNNHKLNRVERRSLKRKKLEVRKFVIHSCD